jgi:hypothetical protein
MIYNDNDLSILKNMPNLKLNYVKINNHNKSDLFK